MLDITSKNIISKLSPLPGSSANESLLRFSGIPDTLLLSRRGFSILNREASKYPTTFRQKVVRFFGLRQTDNNGAAG